MTRAEAFAFNAGVEAMRSIARAAANRIEADGKRPLPEAFAVSALRQLAHDAEHLLQPTEPAGDASETTEQAAPRV